MFYISSILRAWESQQYINTSMTVYLRKENCLCRGTEVRNVWLKLSVTGLIKVIILWLSLAGNTPLTVLSYIIQIKNVVFYKFKCTFILSQIESMSLIFCIHCIISVVKSSGPSFLFSFFFFYQLITYLLSRRI